MAPLAMGAAMSTVRMLRSNLLVPVGARCRLCNLYVDVDEGGGSELEVRYGCDADGDDGDELVALRKFRWLCADCVAVIRKVTP